MAASQTLSLSLSVSHRHTRRRSRSKAGSPKVAFCKTLPTQETSCDLLQERFRKENTSKYRRLCLTLAYLKPRNHRHQQLWLRSLSLSSIPPKFNYLSLLSLTQCVSILPGWCSLGTWCGDMQACCNIIWVYFDYMRSFRVEFDKFFEEGIISEIEVGLGLCGELRYPSYPERHDWKYPGIGEF